MALRILRGSLAGILYNISKLLSTRFCKNDRIIPHKVKSRRIQYP